MRQKGGELTHAKITDEPVFELVESNSGKARGVCKLSLSPASRKTGAADGLAEFLEIHVYL